MADKLKVAILGGSFNPVTLGHLQCARYVMDNTDVERVWLTPCFSHMWNKKLLPPNHRYVMCLLATDITSDITPLNFEINNKITTGTFDFLSLLMAHYPEIDFSYIIGMDNANQFNKWARANEVLAFPVGCNRTPIVIVPGWEIINNASRNAPKVNLAINED